MNSVNIKINQMPVKTTIKTVKTAKIAKTTKSNNSKQKLNHIPKNSQKITNYFTTNKISNSTKLNQINQNAKMLETKSDEINTSKRLEISHKSEISMLQKAENITKTSDKTVNLESHIDEISKNINIPLEMHGITPGFGNCWYESCASLMELNKMKK